MATYQVKVVVELEYEVEADSVDEAKREGWKWENYTQFSVVDEITVSEDEDEDEDDEGDDEYALASAGHGNDEDY